MDTESSSPEFKIEQGEKSTFADFMKRRESVKNTPAASTSVDETPSDSAPESDDEDGTKPETEPTKKSRGDKRFDKLTKEKTALESERDLWKKQALEGKPATEPAVKTKVESEGKVKPKADDFNTHDEYVEALTDWKLDEKLAKIDAEAKETERKESAKKLDEKWNQQKEDARSRYDDFDDVMENEEIMVPAVVADTFLNSEVGADVAYWWGTNPDKVKDLIKLSPTALAREMGKIEDRILRQQNVESETEERANSKSQVKPKPKPITPLSGEGKGVIPRKLADAQNFSDFLKIRGK